MSYPEIGIHTVNVGERSIYEAESGALMFCAEFIVDEFRRITGFQCLANKDGAINEHGMKCMREALGWSGGDLDSLFEHVINLPQDHQVSIVVEEEPGTDNKLYPKVKWINAVGGGGGGVKPMGDRKAILAKYGNKFRAMAGGSQMPRSSPKPKTSTSPAPANTAPTPPAPSGRTSDMMEVWGKVCKIKPVQEEAAAFWGELVGTVGKPQEQITPQEWGGLLEKVEKFATPEEAENFPY